MSRLRAKCPDCRTLTAVAIADEYQCHSCGREFRAGLVRVPRAWGRGGEPMVEAAHIELDYPEAAVVDEDTLATQNLALAAELPNRPLVVGGDCCAHIGAVEGLASRHDGVAVVWLDAHGDLNTPQTSPSGNEWGMPLRMLIDAGTVPPQNVALVGARNLDPPEEDFIAAAGINVGREDAIDGALRGCSCVYVALDVDSLDPSEYQPFMPEPDGLTVDEVEALFVRLRERSTILGLGITGNTPEPANVPKLERLTAALGL